MSLNADLEELIMGTNNRINEKGLKIPFRHIKKVLYFFSRINSFIEKKYGRSYTLGQWATIRNLIEPEDWDK